MCQFNTGCPGHKTEGGYVPCESEETCASSVFVCERRHLTRYRVFVPCETCETLEMCDMMFDAQFGSNLSLGWFRHDTVDGYPLSRPPTDEELSTKYNLACEDICDYCVAHQGLVLRSTCQGERRVNGACWKCGME